jgi:hypothetical protein
MCRDKFGLVLNPGDAVMYADGLGMDTATITNIFGPTKHCSGYRVHFQLTELVSTSRPAYDVVKVHTVQGLLHKAYPELFI